MMDLACDDIGARVIEAFCNPRPAEIGVLSEVYETRSLMPGGAFFLAQDGDARDVVSVNPTYEEVRRNPDKIELREAYLKRFFEQHPSDSVAGLVYDPLGHFRGLHSKGLIAEEKLEQYRKELAKDFEVIASMADFESLDAQRQCKEFLGEIIPETRAGFSREPRKYRPTGYIVETFFPEQKGDAVTIYVPFNAFNRGKTYFDMIMFHHYTRADHIVNGFNVGNLQVEYTADFEKKVSRPGMVLTSEVLAGIKTLEEINRRGIDDNETRDYRSMLLTLILTHHSSLAHVTPESDFELDLVAEVRERIRTTMKDELGLVEELGLDNEREPLNFVECYLGEVFGVRLPLFVPEITFTDSVSRK